MTTTTHTGSPQRGPENYTTSAGLRALLARLHAAGPGAWARDPVAGELMQYAAQKYAALARKHSLDPWEAASADLLAREKAHMRAGDALAAERLQKVIGLLRRASGGGGARPETRLQEQRLRLGGARRHPRGHLHGPDPAGRPGHGRAHR